MEAVWLVKNSAGEIGGGICVEDTGVVFTCSSLVRTHDVSAGSVLGRSENTQFRKLEIFLVNRSLDLAILRVSVKKNSNSKNVRFGSVFLEDDFDLGRGVQMEAITHLARLPYSVILGRSSYLLPLETTLPPINSDETVTSRSASRRSTNKKEDRDLVLDKFVPWRTIGAVIDPDEHKRFKDLANIGNQDERKEVLKRIRLLVYISKNANPDLPLVQVQLQDLCWGEGMVGCPVFCRLGDNYLLTGILSFGKGPFFIRHPNPCDQETS